VDAFVGRKGDIAFTASTPAQPSERIHGVRDDPPKRLTDFNHEIAALALSKGKL